MPPKPEGGRTRKVRFAAQNGQRIHLCRFQPEGKPCDPCTFWSQGTCTRGKGCGFCHIMPGAAAVPHERHLEVNVAAALKYCVSLGEGLQPRPGQEEQQKELLQALRDFEKETHAGSLRATSSELERVIDDPDEFHNFPNSIGAHEVCEEVEVSSPPSPRIWRWRCARALYVNLTQMINERTAAIGLWLAVTKTARQHMSHFMDPVALSAECEAYSLHLGDLLGKNPARNAIEGELRRAYDDSPQHPGEYEYVLKLIRDVHQFVNLLKPPDQVVSWMEDDDVSWKPSPEERERWRLEGGPELHRAFFAKIAAAQDIDAIVGWLACVEAATISLERRPARGGALPKEKVVKMLKFLVKMLGMLGESGTAGAFHGLFSSEFPEDFAIIESHPDL